MAFAAVGTWGVTCTFRDRDGNKSRVQLYAPSTVALADITTWINGTLAPSMAALSDAVLDKVTASQDYEDAALVASTPVEACDIERKGVFVWRKANKRTSKTEIPSVKNTLVEDFTNLIPNTGVVTTFIDWMTDTGLFDTVGMADRDGVQLTALASAAHKIHRQSAEG